MSWEKHFQVVNTDKRLKTALERSQRDSNIPSNGALGKYSSVLPEVYAGHPLRIERYSQYDQMDMDSEVNTSLDTISDFCTQRDPNTDEIFEILFNDPPGDAEVEILKTCLHQWSKINEFKKRIWRAFRSTLKYGDQFFIRDPETLKWFWVEQSAVEKILVNDAEGKEPEAYLIRNLNLNSTNLSATQSTQYGNNVQGAGTTSLNQLGITGISVGRSAGPVGGVGKSGGSDNAQGITAVDATHVVHLSLSEGLDANWPFGTSILESVFKTFKQKELLEDAIIIYRIIRAPERRIFYVDVGQMPPHKAGAYLERVKNEIHQKRIPTKNGGGSSISDSVYNPMCLDMSTRIPLTDGRTLSISKLAQEYEQGKENWVYSSDPKTKSMTCGPICFAGVTRKDATVIKLHFSNSTSLICTPDHKFPIIGGEVVQAKDLTPDSKLLPSGATLIALTNIEQLDYKLDTGTLSINNEHHNFAIEQGVIIMNSMIDDFFFAQSNDGRGSKVETLPGGENLGQIDDLRYWNNKLIRGLRVPSSYLPTGPDDGQQSFNDGRVGTAYIQEFRFAQYCQRLQNLLSPVFDKEFKLFVKQRGFNIDSSSYELTFTTPEHFSDSARVAKDAEMINVFSPLVEQKFFSKRFLMKRYLGMTEAEVTENELFWRQENPDAVENTGESTAGGTADSTVDAGAPPSIDSMGLEDQSSAPEDATAGDETGSPISGAENSPDPSASPDATPTGAS